MNIPHIFFPRVSLIYNSVFFCHKKSHCQNFCDNLISIAFLCLILLIFLHNIFTLMFLKLKRIYLGVYSVQFSSVTQSCLILCDPMNCSTPGLPVHHQLLVMLKLMSIELAIPSNHLILCRPLLLPSVFPSIRVCFNESALHIRWPKY